MSTALKTITQPVHPMVGTEHPQLETSQPAIMDPDTGMREAVSQILACVGEDPTRDGLRETPRRVAKMYGELLGGYFQDLDKIVNRARFEVEYGAGEMVMASDIEYVSMCEHHMLPFTGKAHVVYIPKDRVIGLSKIPRIVDMFAHRLQVQERLTNEIADAMEKAISPAAVMVVLEGQHSCAALRGGQEARDEHDHDGATWIFPGGPGPAGGVLSLAGQMRPAAGPRRSWANDPGAPGLWKGSDP